MRASGADLIIHKSKEINMPTIIVTLNYRVGFYGFLASDDIRDDNAQFGGGNGNQGILDQKNALLWVHEVWSFPPPSFVRFFELKSFLQHISSFGGDPSRVLLTGQSAGAGTSSSGVYS